MALIWRRLISAAACIAILPSSVFAQTVFSSQETRRIIHRYGACAVKHHAGGASKAILRNIDILDLKAHYSALIDGDCMVPGGRLDFPGDFYLYALADALVARVLGPAPVPDLSNVPPLQRRLTPEFSVLKRKYGYDAALATTATADTFGPVNEFGECVVRHSPAKAKTLLMTQPESGEEVRSFEDLQPAFTACAPKDSTMKLKKLLLRGTIALNYYRLAQAALHVPVH